MHNCMLYGQGKAETYNILSILGKPDDRGDDRRHVDIAEVWAERDRTRVAVELLWSWGL